jgi:asparagine N-glycosylation enzyme membrane subunit Stt3
MSNRSAAASGVPTVERGAADPRIVILMLCAAVALALAAPSINSGVFDAMSTDDAMRLVEVNDLIAGQGWFDLIQPRLDPPGSLMHWSRVIDVPLAALILMLRPLAGTAGAEAITLFVWPTLLFGAALLLVAAIAKRMSDDVNQPAVQLAAIVLAALSVPALIHFRAGAIDHHNFQIVLLLCFLFLTLGIERSSVDASLAGFPRRCHWRSGWRCCRRLRRRASQSLAF